MDGKPAPWHGWRRTTYGNWATAQRRAEDLLSLMRQDNPVLIEAELALRHLYPVTIYFGLLDDEDEEDLVHNILPSLARATGDSCTLRATFCGPDHVTFLFEGSTARRMAHNFLADAITVTPADWSSTATAKPYIP